MDPVPVPMDLSKIKPKLFFNLTARQILCFGSGACVGVPLFLLLKDRLNPTLSAMMMVAVMMPFFLFAMFEKNGEPLERVLLHVYMARFARSQTRPYQTNNLYTVIERQAAAEREVDAIVKKAKARCETHTGRKKADRGDSGQSEE